MSPSVMFTIGHSTRSQEEFLELLQINGVTFLADVRSYPRSRTNPQFNTEILQEFLAKAGIAYEHMPQLGGRRRSRADSTNTVWKNESFRGYADYMETQAFERGLQHLIDLSVGSSTAFMCSEAVWWRCHRSLIADALLAKGIPVQHIISLTSCSPHKLRDFAHVRDGRIVYG